MQKLMKEINNKQYTNDICLRCRNENSNHDIKISIRKDSFLENERIELILMYFLIIWIFFKTN